MPPRNSALISRFKQPNANAARIATGEYVRRIIVEKWGKASELEAEYKNRFPDLTCSKINNICYGRQKMRPDLAQVLSENTQNNKDFWLTIEEKALEVCPRIMALSNAAEIPAREEGEMPTDKNPEEPMVDGLTAVVNSKFVVRTGTGTTVTYLANSDGIEGWRENANRIKVLEEIHGPVEVTITGLEP